MNKAGFGTNEKTLVSVKRSLSMRFGALLIKRRDAVLKQYLLKKKKSGRDLEGIAGKSEEELTARTGSCCKL